MPVNEKSVENKAAITQYKLETISSHLNPLTP